MDLDEELDVDPEVGSDLDGDLVAGLRSGDESAFAALVERYHRRLIGLALTFVDRRETAEDVAQETWVAVLRGIDRFEGRSGLRPWLFQICANRARTQAVRDHRQPPMAGEPAIEQFDQAGGWGEQPLVSIQESAEELELRARRARAAIERLPATQRHVVTLRDVDGLSSEETCRILGLTAGNQRVLLHRGRATIRRAVSLKQACRHR